MTPEAYYYYFPYYDRDDKIWDYYYDDASSTDDDYTTDDSLDGIVASDDFESFDSGLWNERCSGCSYSSGTLNIPGDSKLMRTVGTFSDLQRIKGTLIKSSSCNDHLLAVSTLSTLADGGTWTWGSTAGTARFAWNW